MNKKNQSGATLVELILAIVIITIALFGILSVFKITVNNSANPIVRKQAILASESLLEEVLSKSFVKPTGGFSGPFTVVNRSQFDTVTDYNGLTVSGISNISGVAIVGLENYSAAITATTQTLGTIVAADTLLVTVTVTSPHDTYVLNGYRINYDN